VDNPVVAECMTVGEEQRQTAERDSSDSSPVSVLGCDYNYLCVFAILVDPIRLVYYNP
jgi:hypothetical protein